MLFSKQRRVQQQCHIIYLVLSGPTRISFPVCSSLPQFFTEFRPSKQELPLHGQLFFASIPEFLLWYHAVCLTLLTIGGFYDTLHVQSDEEHR